MQDELPRARKLKRPAVEFVLRAHYPRVCRVAYALCGDDDAAKSAVKLVMNQSLRALPNWRNETQAGNWFLHHTILKSRDLAPPPHQMRQDSLLRSLIRPSPEYLAFLRAFRQLPPQQREAFVLFRGEKLDPRLAAVAMDCSTAAAANHLAAANKSLETIAVDTFETRAAALLQVYASLTPPDNLIIGDIGIVSRKLGRRKFLRFLERILALAILSAVAWIVWRLSKMIVI
jgi:DNA-directed RNA polymerase specialized sigma24 family protein